MSRRTGGHPYQRRLLKEYSSLCKANLEGVTMVHHSDNMSEYIFRIEVSNHPIYKRDDGYYLSVEITDEYPVDSPRVQFVKYESIDDDNAPPLDVKIPIHPHIYSNGHICLNLLGEDWTPACTIETIVLSIQSMLGSNQLCERPPDDTKYVKHAPLNPKLVSFMYHDDDV